MESSRVADFPGSPGVKAASTVEGGFDPWLGIAKVQSMLMAKIQDKKEVLL